MFSISLSAIIYILIALFMFSFLIPKSKSTIYGSARFGKNKYLGWWNRGIQIGFRKLTKNKSYQGALLLGNTGSGKTQSILAYNIFRAARYHSIICTDPKLELHKLASGYIRQVLKAKVLVLNLADPSQSICWNPFVGKQKKDLQGLMTKLYDIVNTKTGVEAIWRVGAIDILTTFASILHVYEEGKYLNIANLMFLMHNFQAYPDTVQSWVHEHIQDPQIVLSVDRTVALEDKIKHGMLSGAIASLTAFSSESILHISAHHSMPSLREFREQRTVLFLGMPIAEDSSYTPFLTLFLSEFFSDVLRDELQPTDKSLLLLLEEFGNLHKISDPSFSNVITTIRAKRCMTLVCLQSLDQLAETYGDNAGEVIADNCNCWIILPGLKSNKTLISVTETLLGSTTAEYIDPATKRTHISHKMLMTKDEVRRLDKNRALVISDRERPTIVRLLPMYKNWWLRWKYGLRSRHGQLVSKYTPVTHTFAQQEIDYISLDTNAEDDDQLQFTSLLNKYFPDNP